MDKEDRVTEVVQTRLRPADFRAVEDIARRDDCSIAAVARRLIVAGLNEQPSKDA